MKSNNETERLHLSSLIHNHPSINEAVEYCFQRSSQISRSDLNVLIEATIDMTIKALDVDRSLFEKVVKT